MEKFLQFSLLHTYAPFGTAGAARSHIKYKLRNLGIQHVPENWETCLDLMPAPALDALYIQYRRNHSEDLDLSYVIFCRPKAHSKGVLT